MSKKSEAVFAEIDNYLDHMEQNSKKPSSIYVCPKQMEIVLQAKRMAAKKDKQPNRKITWTEYLGIPVVLVGVDAA